MRIVINGWFLVHDPVFGSVTGRDPRSLGDNECSAYELGISTAEVRRLQQVAFDQLKETGDITPNPLVLPKPVTPERCVAR